LGVFAVSAVPGLAGVTGDAGVAEVFGVLAVGSTESPTDEEPVGTFVEAADDAGSSVAVDAQGSVVRVETWRVELVPSSAAAAPPPATNVPTSAIAPSVPETTQTLRGRVFMVILLVSWAARRRRCAISLGGGDEVIVRRG
jgi:hypothetical protein